MFNILAPLRRVSKPARTQEQVTSALQEGQTIELLRVRDPRASAQSGEQFLLEHRAWLLQQLRTQHAHAGGRLLRGETQTLPVHGRQHPLHWHAGRTTKLEWDEHDNVHFSAPPQAGVAALQRALRDFYEAQGRTDLGRWLPRYLHGLPRPPRQFIFKRTTTQWGSLAPDGTVSLDLALLLARPSAFEYVLVHELCHLLHANHSAHFWRAVETRFPAWRAERDYLRVEGRALKGRLRQLLAG